MDRLSPAELAKPPVVEAIPDQPHWPARLSQLVRSYPRPFGMLRLLLISLALDLYPPWSSTMPKTVALAVAVRNLMTPGEPVPFCGHQ